MSLDKSDWKILELTLDFAKALDGNNQPAVFLQKNPNLLSDSTIQSLKRAASEYTDRGKLDTVQLIYVMCEFLESCTVHGVDHMIEFFGKYRWDFPQFFIVKNTINSLYDQNIRQKFKIQLDEMNALGRKNNDVAAVQLSSAILNLLDGMHPANIRIDKLTGISLRIWQAILKEVEVNKDGADQLSLIFDKIARTELQPTTATTIIALCREGLELVEDKTSTEASVLYTTLGRVLLVVPSDSPSGNIEEAIRCFNQALKIDTYERNKIQWLGLNINLAGAYQMRLAGVKTENINRAISLLEHLLEEVRIDESTTAWCYAHMNLGMCYLELTNDDMYANLQKAISHLTNALQAADQDTYPDVWGTIHLNLTKCHSKLLEFQDHLESVDLLYEKVKYHAKKGLEVFSKDLNPAQWASINNNLAGIFYLEGDQKKALSIFEEVYSMRDELGMLEAIDTLQNIALLHSSIAPETSAEMHLSILERITPQESPNAWSHSHWELARKYLIDIKVFVDNGQNPELLFEKVVFHSGQAVKFKDKVVFPEDHYASLSNIGLACYLMGNWHEASRYFIQSLELTSGSNDLSYTDIGRNQKARTVSSICLAIAECLIHIGDITRAFEFLEKAKVQNLKQSLASNGLVAGNHQGINQMELKQLREKIKNLELSLREEYGRNPLKLDEKRLHELKVARETYRKKFRFDEEDMPFANLATAIENDVLVIAPILLESKGYLFVIPSGTTKLSENNIIEINVTGETLRMIIEGINTSDPAEKNRFYQGDETYMSWNLANYFLVNGSPFYSDAGMLELWKESFDVISQELWKCFVAPIEKLLKSDGRKNLLFIHQGGTQILPIHAAWKYENGQRRFLIEEHNIRYSPSMQVLWQIKQNKQAYQPADHDFPGLVIGVTDYSKYSGLKYVHQEVELISRLFPGSAKLLNVEKDVLEKDHKAKKFIHLACHAYFSTEKNPMKSGLVLGGDIPLTLMEIIARFDFSDCSFITLSACETGMVKIHPNPEEFVGLPSGFLQAGAPAVISALWSVSDFSTSLLMILFYNQIRSGKDISFALADAQRVLLTNTRRELSQIIKSDPELESSFKLSIIQHLLDNDKDVNEKPYSHPYHWAPFSMIGVDSNGFKN